MKEIFLCIFTGISAHLDSQIFVRNQQIKFFSKGIYIFWPNEKTVISVNNCVTASDGVACYNRTSDGVSFNQGFREAFHVIRRKSHDMTLSEQGRDITSIPKPLDIISITYRVQLLFCYCSRMVVKTSSYEVCSISNRMGYTLSLSAPECSMMSSTDTSEPPLASMKALIRWTSRDLLSGWDMMIYYRS